MRFCRRHWGCRGLAMFHTKLRIKNAVVADRILKIAARKALFSHLRALSQNRLVSTQPFQCCQRNLWIFGKLPNSPRLCDMLKKRALRYSICCHCHRIVG